MEALATADQVCPAGQRSPPSASIRAIRGDDACTVILPEIVVLFRHTRKMMKGGLHQLFAVGAAPILAIHMGDGLSAER
jgi:hypothetical protein